MSVLKKIDQGLTKLLAAFTAVLVFAMSIVILLQIAIRLTGDPLTWSEEVARIMMVWLIFLGAAYLYNMPKNGHIVVDALLTVLPPKWVEIIGKFTQILVAVFVFVTLYYGLTLLGQSKTVVLAATKISLFWVYLSVPVSMALMAFFSICKFLKIDEEIEGMEDNDLI